MANKPDETREPRFFNFWTGVATIVGFGLGGLLGAWFYGIYFFNISPVVQNKFENISNADVISVVNTYIVFVSIIFILFTIGVTIGGYLFAKTFTSEKLREIHQNIVIIASKMKNDEDTREVFIDALFSEGPIAEDIIEKLAEIADRIFREKSEENNKVQDFDEITANIKEVLKHKLNEGKKNGRNPSMERRK